MKNDIHVHSNIILNFLEGGTDVLAECVAMFIAVYLFRVYVI